MVWLKFLFWLFLFLAFFYCGNGEESGIGSKRHDFMSASHIFLSLAKQDIGSDPASHNSSGVTSIPSYKASDKAKSNYYRSFRGRIAYGTTEFWCFVGISVFTIAFAGFASGMTVGLLSLDPIQLRVASFNGTDDEKESAKAVSKLVENHHLLLVTLLLANSIAMEALPIFLDRLVPSWMAVMLSVTCILFFGEVIPQALCTGPKQLTIASAMAPAVQLLIACLFFIAYPVSRLLDWVLGDHEQTLYTRSHLKALIRMHQKEQRHGSKSGHNSEKESNAESALGADEVVVIEGALDLANKTLEEIMVPIGGVYMLEWDTELTLEVMQEIIRGGHSRIPVYRGSRDNVRGLVMVKSLILIDPKEGVKAYQLLQPKLPLFERPDQTAYNMLNEFQKGASHMAFVTNDCDQYKQCLPAGADVPSEARILGLATLEDVIEELIQEEIYDEFDNPHKTSIQAFNIPQIIGAKMCLPRSLSRQSTMRLCSVANAAHIQSIAATCHSAPVSTNEAESATGSSASSYLNIDDRCKHDSNCNNLEYSEGSKTDSLPCKTVKTNIKPSPASLADIQQQMHPHLVCLFSTSIAPCDSSTGEAKIPAADDVALKGFRTWSEGRDEVDRPFCSNFLHQISLNGVAEKSGRQHENFRKRKHYPQVTAQFDAGAANEYEVPLNTMACHAASGVNVPITRSMRQSDALALKSTGVLQQSNPAISSRTISKSLPQQASLCKLPGNIDASSVAGNLGTSVQNDNSECTAGEAMSASSSLWSPSQVSTPSETRHNTIDLSYNRHSTSSESGTFRKANMLPLGKGFEFEPPSANAGLIESINSVVTKARDSSDDVYVCLPGGCE